MPVELTDPGIPEPGAPGGRRATALLLALGLLVTSACSASHPAGSAPPSSGGAGGGTATGPTQGSAPGPTATTGGTRAGPQGWFSYQGGPTHQGTAPEGPAGRVRRIWSDDLDGTPVRGQPLVVDGLVVVATEGDDTYGIDPGSGRVVWRRQLGSPLRDAPHVAGCGNIPTLGVTSTPVADPTSGVVFVVAETATGTPPAVSFHLFGLDAANGAVTFERDVTPPLPQGENPVHLLQRAALALGNGRVYVAYGGQYGDCGLYHGWVVSAPVSGTGPDEAFDVTPAASGGAIWDGGSGPVVEPDGTVLVTTGNPNGGGGPAPWAEAVLALPPGLGASPDAVFVDPAATGDLDLATGGAVPVPGNLILAVGKTDIGYLLDPVGLSLVARVGGQVCGSDPDGGAAVDAADDTVYVPCRDGGIQEIDLRSRHTGWRSGPANSTVVLAGGRLWSVSYPRGELTALDPATGTVEQTVEAGPVPTFASVSVWGGRVLVPTDSGLSSFG